MLLARRVERADLDRRVGLAVGARRHLDARRPEPPRRAPDLVASARLGRVDALGILDRTELLGAVRREDDRLGRERDRVEDELLELDRVRRRRLDEGPRLVEVLDLLLRA